MASAAAPAHAQSPASSARFAPETAPDQKLLVRITLNGLDRGEQLVAVSGNDVALPTETMKALHITASNNAALQLGAADGVRFHLDQEASALTLDLPGSMLDLQQFAPETPTIDVHLSPETWGAYVNYDVNARHPIVGGGQTAFGGVADLRLLGPDLLGSFGWAYDSAASGRGGPARLDSTLSWRPANDNLIVSGGDLSPRADPLSLTRPYRYLGLQVGTDYSAAIGWSSAPLAGVSGSAEAQSVLDLYINGQRTYSTSTAGGPFALSVPAGTAAGTANLVVTDVSGRQVLVPVEVPRVNAELLRQGLALWSVGVGAPRFGFGTSQSTYLPDVYGHASIRYGAFERVTLRGHGEFGPGLSELEFGADAVVTPTIAVRGTVAVSRSARGVGGAGRLAFTAVGPWNLSFDASVARRFGRFDDVVSVSGRTYAAQHGFSPAFTLPSDSELTARVAWQATQRLGLSASYQVNHYPGTGAAGIAAVSANYTVGNLPFFVNAFRSLGGRRSTTVIAGLSFQLGEAQGSVSSGVSAEDGEMSGIGRRVTSSFSVAQPLREEVGSVGWNAFGTRSPTGMFGTGQVEARTGFGIPGVGVQSFGSSVMGLATLRGSAGVVGWHPFLSDPAQGGLIIVDAGRSGVPVQMNGFDRGRTSFDGKIALGGAVPGVPQQISIDTADLPIDSVPTVTEGQATVRDGSATLLPFRVQSAGGAASFRVAFEGQPPPVGSTVISTTANAPIGKDGRAYLASIAADEVLRVEMPDGRVCLIHTDFNGRGGVGRRLGTLECKGVTG